MGIFSLEILVWILNEGWDLLIWTNSSLVTVIWLVFSWVSTVVFLSSIVLTFSVCVSWVLLLLTFFSGTVCVTVKVLSDLELSSGVLELLFFGSVDLESAESFLESEFVDLTELEALAVMIFYESFEDCATSSVISTIFGLGDLLGLEMGWEEWELCLFSLGRIFKTFVFGASTFFLFWFWELFLVEDSLFLLCLRLYWLCISFMESHNPVYSQRIHSTLIWVVEAQIVPDLPKWGKWYCFHLFPLYDWCHPHIHHYFENFQHSSPRMGA